MRSGTQRERAESEALRKKVDEERRVTLRGGGGRVFERSQNNIRRQHTYKLHSVYNCREVISVVMS